VSGPTQPKVEGEEWSDERIKEFLTLKPLDGTDPDFHVLHQAYIHMIPEFFERFLVVFKEAGRNLNAKALTGETMLERLSKHRRAAVYLELLRKVGA
jgi:hypothetical protein